MGRFSIIRKKHDLQPTESANMPVPSTPDHDSFRGPNAEDEANAAADKKRYKAEKAEWQKELDLIKRKAELVANEKAFQIWRTTPDALSVTECPKCLSVALIRKFEDQWRPAFERYTTPKFVPGAKSEFDYYFARTADKAYRYTSDTNTYAPISSFANSDPYEGLKVTCNSCDHVFYERPADVNKSNETAPNLRSGPVFDAVVRFLQESNDMHSPKWRAETILNIIEMTEEKSSDAKQSEK